MTLCACGELTYTSAGQCSRCEALTTLDLATGASKQEIKSAYRMLVQYWNPDQYPAGSLLRTTAEEKLETINEAYALLSSRPAGKQTMRSALRAADRETQRKARQGWADTERRKGWKPKENQLGKNGLSQSATFLVTAFVIVVCLAALGIMLMRPMDAMLSNNPLTSSVYYDLKLSIQERVENAAGGIHGNFGSKLKSWLNFPSASAMPIDPELAKQDEAILSSEIMPHFKGAKPQPFITAGLSQNAVIRLQGVPTSATTDKLVYPDAELYFDKGKLTGWKIDRGAALHIKLQPVAPSSLKLKTFSLGSTKDDVLLVQGTPSLYSASTFGYDGSEVYFLNDRVVGWKNDPASVHLHVNAR